MGGIGADESLQDAVSGQKILQGARLFAGVIFYCASQKVLSASLCEYIGRLFGRAVMIQRRNK